MAKLIFILLGIVAFIMAYIVYDATNWIYTAIIVILGLFCFYVGFGGVDS